VWLTQVESELRGTQAALATAEGEAQTLRKQLRVGLGVHKRLSCMSISVGMGWRAEHVLCQC
jgi:hypothetical protein